MTEELIFWVLLIAMVGFVWVFTCVILTQNRPSTHGADEDVGHHRQDGQSESEDYSKKVAA